MRQYIHTFLCLVATIVTPLHAQEILLWKIDNTASPTMVPAYDGQPSPFPKKEAPKQTVAVSETLSVEAEAARKARLAALAKAQKILSSPEAFKPELNTIEVNGVIQGIQGTRALIANQWVTVGQTMQVRSGRTPEVATAIEALRQYDADTATQLEDKLQQRFNANPYITLKIKKITTKQITLEGHQGTYQLPIEHNEIQ
ncbi:MAG: hypothetical protein EBQ80_00965 [Proteobacteria bacterium]|nr:hypothetical protein [Pseudomonadota bacterium]